MHETKGPSVQKTENRNLRPLTLGPLRRMVWLILIAQVGAVLLHLAATAVAWMVWGPTAGAIAFCLPVIAELFALVTALEAGLDWYVWSAGAWACLALVAFTQHRSIFTQ